MDAAKLRNVLYDLTKEQEISINNLLGQLKSTIAAAEFIEAQKTLEELRNLYEKSSVQDYTPSNIKIVESITSDLFFGIAGYNRLNNIISQNALNTTQRQADLEKYINSRISFIDQSSSVYKILGDFKINNHFNNTYIFELGLLMPETYTKNKIANITKELNQWDKIIKTLTEISGHTPEETKLSFINNGSFEFFTDIDPVKATMVAFCIEKVLSLYKRILEIKEAKLKLKSLGVPLPKSDKEQEQEFAKNGVEEIAKELLEKFAAKQIDEGRINELKIAVKGHLTYIAKSLNQGLVIEINPPELTEPDPLIEGASSEEKESKSKELEEYKISLEKISIIQKSMEIVNEVNKLGKGVIKYFLDGETPNEDSDI